MMVLTSMRFAFLFVAAPFVLASGGLAQSTDSAVFARAQRLASGGEGARGRALVDSVLAATAPGTLPYAEGLYWRGMLAATAADAERAYLELSVEYPLSPRASFALLRLSQLEAARGDKDGAHRHLARLVREHPTGITDPRGALWAASFLFDETDAPNACILLAKARSSVPVSDVELANQLEYQTSRCVGVATDRPANVEGADTSKATNPAETAVRAPASSRTPAARSKATGPGFTIQIAAYKAKSDADALARHLTKRGHEARVVGNAAPYRVRVGRYA